MAFKHEPVGEFQVSDTGASAQGTAALRRSVSKLDYAARPEIDRGVFRGGIQHAAHHKTCFGHLPHRLKAIDSG